MVSRLIRSWLVDYTDANTAREGFRRQDIVETIDPEQPDSSWLSLELCDTRLMSRLDRSKNDTGS